MSFLAAPFGGQLPLAIQTLFGWFGEALASITYISSVGANRKDHKVIDSTVNPNWSIDQFHLAEFADFVRQKSRAAFEFDFEFGHRYPAESERLNEEVHNYIVEMAEMMWSLKLSELVELVVAKPLNETLADAFFESWIKEGVFDSTTDADHEWSEWTDSFGDYVTAKHIWQEANGFRGL